MKLPKEFLLSELLRHNVKGNATLNYGNGENVWMHPPVHRILGWYSRPSNLDLKRNVWKLNQISQIIDNDIFVKGDPAISDLATLNRFPNLIEASLVNSEGSKIGVIADFLFEMKTGNIKFYLISRSNPRIPGSSRWKLNIENIVDQQPGLVFCSRVSLDDFPLIKSSIKYEFFKKGKKIIEEHGKLLGFGVEGHERFWKVNDRLRPEIRQKWLYANATHTIDLLSFFVFADTTAHVICIGGLGRLNRCSV